jgi:protein gp37
MGDKSAIEWTDATWSPVTGCTKTSPACASCYIERTVPFRTKGRRFVKGHIPLEFHENRIDAPLRWREPRTVFVCSTSDLFHDDVPWAFIERVFDVMQEAARHTFQVLTKRADNMRMFAENWAFHHGGPLPNVWLGVSVENQHFADERIPLLLQTPAAVRFLSCEPLLGKVLIDNGTHSYFTCRSTITEDEADEKESRGEDFYCCDSFMEHGEHYHGIDWVIAGGESGPNVRPSNPDWFRSLRDQCVAVGVPFFFKQWGGRTSKSGGRLLDGVEWNQLPEVR